MATLNKASYESDVIAWANEQVRLLRAGRFAELDIEHIAEEIEDVGKSERRELRNRMIVLLSHLLKWQSQPERRGSSWRKTINVQRRDIKQCLIDMPSLKPDLQDFQWRESVWASALDAAVKETGLTYETFPEDCPWTFEEALDADYWPGGLQ